MWGRTSVKKISQHLSTAPVSVLQLIEKDGAEAKKCDYVHLAVHQVISPFLGMNSSRVPRFLTTFILSVGVLEGN